MNKNERIFTKRDIVVFSTISLLCSISFVFEFCDDYTLIEDVIRLIADTIFFYIPPILAVILNLIFKLTNIENEKIIKITKIIFFPIIFLLMFLEGVLTVLLIL